MRHCPECRVDVKGNWQKCPLCHTPLEGDRPVASPYPDVPLRFDRRKGQKILLAASFFIILASFPLGLLWRGKFGGLQGALFGILTMWLAVLVLIRKRRNLAKGILYLLISLSLICAYLDYLVGWTGWSLTYAIPILCCSSLLAMFLAVRFVKMKAGDYVLYVLSATLLGLVPLLFLMLEWVVNPIPSWTSVGLSVVLLLLILLFQGREIRKELAKRLFI